MIWYFVAMIGLSRKGDLAIGDYEPRLLMFIYAVVSIAVANAGRTMQVAVRFVAPSNEAFCVLV
jgi:hydroxymethylpyrimidine pyrophosphatase-like HAD family hydrolase